MKLRLLLGIVFFALMSCSGDDSNETVNTNEPVTETPVDSVPATDSVPPAEEPAAPDGKYLKSIKFAYPSDSEPFTIIKFENNRATEFSMKNQMGDYILYQRNIYDNNLLSVVENYNLTTGIFNGKKYIYYNSQGQIIQFKNVLSNDNTSTYNFSYNSNNTITVNQYPDGINFTFYKNSSGQIYKVNAVTYGYQQEVIYNGNNIVSISQTNDGNTDTRTVSYNYDIEVKGSYLKYYRNASGTMNNIILTALGFDVFLFTADNYKIHESEFYDGVSAFNYEYEFDADGYPVKKKQYKQSGLYITETIEYE